MLHMQHELVVGPCSWVEPWRGGARGKNRLCISSSNENKSVVGWLVGERSECRRFGFDVVIAEGDSHLYKTYVEFFSRVRENPVARKGLLRLPL